MKRIFLLGTLVLCLIQTQVFAQKVRTSQDFNVSLSKPYRVIDAKDKLYVSSDDYVVAVKIEKGRDVHVQSFDVASLSQIGVNFYKDFDRNVVFNSLYQISGRFYLLYSLWDSDNETEQLFAREIDPKKGTFKDAGKRIIAVKGKIAGKMNNRGWYNFEVTDKFEIEISASDDRLLIYYRMKPEIKDDSKSHDVYGFHVFDGTLNELWHKTEEMPYTEMKMDMFDLAVNSEGDVYFLSKIYDDNTTDDRKSRKDDNPNYHMEIFVVSNSRPEMVKEVITLKEKFIESLYLFELNKDHMVIGGYYRAPETKYGAEGVFSIKVKKEGELFGMSFHEIPLKILNEYSSKGEKRRNEKDEEKGRSSFKNLYLDEIITNPKGSVTLIGEQYHVESHTHYDANTGRSYTTYTYHYDDILLSKIDPEGKLQWMTRVPKSQVGSSGKGGMSYQYMTNGKDHYVVYLDHIKNLSLPVDKRPYTHSDGKGGFLTSTKVDGETGAVSKKALFDLRDVKGITAYQFTTDRIIQLSENEIAVEVYKKHKEDIWIRVKLN